MYKDGYADTCTKEFRSCGQWTRDMIHMYAETGNKDPRWPKQKYYNSITCDISMYTIQDNIPVLYVLSQLRIALLPIQPLIS